MNREGVILWSTSAAQHELARLSALDTVEAQRPARLSSSWTRRLWAQIRTTSHECEFRLLLPGMIPQGGFLIWRAEQNDRLTVVLWAGREGATIDPLWHTILTRVGGASAPMQVSETCAA